MTEYNKRFPRKRPKKSLSNLRKSPPIKRKVPLSATLIPSGSPDGMIFELFGGKVYLNFLAFLRNKSNRYSKRFLKKWPTPRCMLMRYIKINDRTMERYIPIVYQFEGLIILF